MHANSVSYGFVSADHVPYGRVSYERAARRHEHDLLPYARGLELLRESSPSRQTASGAEQARAELDPRLAERRQLVERARRGDRAAFQEIAQEVGPVLERFLARRLRLDADTVSDIVQDTLFTAWRHMDRIRDADHLRPWLFKVARYKAITWLRRRGPRGTVMDSLDMDRENGREATQRQMARRAGSSRQRGASQISSEQRREALGALSRLVGSAGEEEQEAPIKAPASDTLLREDDLLRRLLHAALPRLRSSYVAVVRLHYLHGHDTGVIAGLLGLRRTTVKMRLHRARRQLRALVREAAVDLAPAARRGVLARLEAAEESRRQQR